MSPGNGATSGSLSSGRCLAVFENVLQTRCVLRVAALRPSELETVDQHLPLNRLDQYVEDDSTYLIAWDGSTLAFAGDPPATAEGVRFETGKTFDQALAAAKEAKKPVFVYFTLDG